MLQCFDGTYYVGITNDFDRRLYEHQSGIDGWSHNKKSALARGDWKLISVLAHSRNVGGASTSSA
ncbi:MAG: GIY-YIG nuclease family protein [Candidatus Eremiobacteraeota bacterium]|nr:GIY-YIG nuclease family protein [Candidatus Eremiobacteraeota bacterium]